MTVTIPPDADPAKIDKLKVDEKAYSQELQRQGKWRHIWRVAARYANISIFDVADHDELNAIIFGLPLFPYMEIKVTALAHHPSAIRQGAA
jgi:muconolactone D-isomerase